MQLSCRICLLSDESKLFPLFQNESGSNTANTAELVTFCSGLEISADDNLPQNICLNCLHQIQSACDIKQKCLETDELLRQKLKDEETQLNLKDSLQLEDYGSIEQLSEDQLHFEVSLQSSKNACVEYIEEQNNEVISESYQRIENKKSIRVNSFRSDKKKKTSIKGNKKQPKPHDYKCFICSEIFDLISIKDLHVKQEHADVKICTICNKRKQTAIALESHLRFHFFGFRFLCQTCGKAFKFKNLLENHMKVEHDGSVMFECDICLYSTRFKINLERHVKSVHLRMKNFKCHSCPDHEYSTQVGLNLHLYRCHNVTAPINCSECSQGFTFDSELRVHKKHCTGSKVRSKKTRPQDSPVDILENGFRCRICLHIYDTRSKWSVHYHHKHKNSNKCYICDKQMASSTSLYKHIQVQHNHVKKFQCDFCSKSFGFKHSLINHKNTHTGAKPFSCSLCSFRSGDRSTISKHKKKIHQRQES